MLSKSSTTYEYDRDGNITKQTTGTTTETHLQNIDGQVVSTAYTIAGQQRAYKYGYNQKDNKLSRIILPTSDSLEYENDKLGRPSLQKLLDSKANNIVQCEYSYYQHKDHATDLVNTHTSIIGSTSGSVRERTRYVYDENGNIKEIRNGFNNITAKYEYDELDRIATETNEKGQKIEYGYDNNGNILYKKTLNSAGAAVSTIPYVYAGDNLLFYNNEKCAYDTLGNPTTYRNNKATWTHLRNLATYTNKLTWTFSYDAGGLRTSKRLSAAQNSRYTWSNGKLLREIRELGAVTTTIDYIYSSDGIIGFYHNTTPYYYIKNLQGDVTAIVNQSGAIQARYTYDAFGNHTVLNPNNTPNTTHTFIGNINPIRYRSYYYDTETGFYYLKSRYYDPQVGRFINADSIDEAHDAKGIVNGLNLYSYCNNNPVMNVDEDGRSWLRNIGNWFKNNWKKIVVGVAVVVAGAVVTALTAGAGTPFMAALGSALLSSAVQVGISTAVGAGIGFVTGGISSGTWQGAFQGMLGGAVDGFMWGGIFAGGAQIVGGGFRIAAKLGVDTGRNSGIYLWKNGPKILSPDKNVWNPKNPFTLSGGTLLKYGKVNRLDTGAQWGLHMHLTLTGAKRHLPIGTIIAGLIGGFND